MKDSAPNLLIVGLDGLDHRLVLRWHLSKLMQRFHGELYVGDISKLYTPLIWSSMLCGFNVEERGYTHEAAVRKSMGRLGPLHAVKKRLFGVEKRSWLARRLLMKVGLLKPPNFILPKDLQRETFLEELRELKSVRTLGIEIPGYNERANGDFRIEMTDLATSNRRGAKLSFVEKVKADSMRRLEEAREALTVCNLVMCYLPLPDLAHHLFFRGVKDKVKIALLYKWIEENVSKGLLRDACESDFKVLILSDHGFDMKKCYHTEYGFWSASFKTQIDSYKDIKERVLDLFH